MTRQTFPWPVAVIPTRVCLIRFDRPPSSLSLRAEQTFSRYTVSDHGFPGSSSCPRRFSRSFWKKGFLGDRYLWSRTWSRRTKQHPFAFCCSRSRVSLSYHRIRGCYISYFRLSMRTRPTRTVNVILFSIQKTTTVCRDNISSRSSISNVSSYAICKSHLLAYCLPASRAPIQLIRIMNILQWTYPVRHESSIAIIICARQGRLINTVGSLKKLKEKIFFSSKTFLLDFNYLSLLFVRNEYLSKWVSGKICEDN